VVAEVFADKKSYAYPDKVVLVADATNLKNCMLLLTQLIDMKIPTILALNMVDLAAQSGQSIDVQAMESQLDLPVVMINARNGLGIEELKKALLKPLKASSKSIFQLEEEIKPLVKKIQDHFQLATPYEAYQYLQQTDILEFLPVHERDYIKHEAKQHEFFPHKYQGAETVLRYGFIQDLLNKIILKTSKPDWKKNSYKIDKILTHKVWGYLIFFSVLFLIFQAIFAWAQIPMDFIDSTFTELSYKLETILPKGPFFELIYQGVIPGIGGIIIFIPQIAILFACISILEESGYMARVVFLMDKIMRKFGLNGKSVVPLISGLACAIPAIMATRTIDNWKDRLITIFVTPLMSCSARLPVFTILVALIIPDVKALGFFNYQGLALMGLYLLGFIAAILSAMAMKFIIKAKERSFLIMELPTYRTPRWGNVGYTILEKTKAFVFEAGKVILAISIILWVLASYGPAGKMDNAEQRAISEATSQNLNEQETQDHIAALKLENSYAGIVGKTLEPVIKPLGYDWKIGIALITSFAAREVFVGTIATIYSIGSSEDQVTIKKRLQSERDPDTGEPRFSFAVGFSLLVFYTFAMQCMSTLAIVKRETKGWKWPAVQLVYMTMLAYLSALIIYQSLS
jgi:ferrous iron transport protein B